ncbi:unnamed protein product [Cuscuta campestris]|uniref:VQ domain-containing protein n=1 Tax=Cuscuta campestris TaxID=132261 RepID=A0A484LHX2_9ASTE|nr:unnamed protein product [Cuscuta campestris]
MTDSKETPDWVQFYQRNVQPQSTVFGTAAAAATATASSPPPSSHGGQLGISPEGRVAKPARRRPRASRRTPTTVFNTDASNFRAMVQQFTGGGLALLPPPSPFSISAAAGLGFRFGPQLQLDNLAFPARSSSSPASNNYSMMFEQHQPPPPCTSLMTSANYGGGGHEQHFSGRASFPPPPPNHHGGSSGDDQNRSETNYML